MRFVDTNLLLYAISTARDERAKAARANDILSSKDLALSVQVLQEFYVQATRRSRSDALPHDDAVRLIEAFMRFPIQEITTGVMQSALTSSERFRISYWDAAIVEAARAIGCEVVLSEDINDGQDYDGVRIENPFAGDRRVRPPTAR